MKQATTDEKYEVFRKCDRAMSELTGEESHMWFPSAWVCTAVDISQPTARRWADELIDHGALEKRRRNQRFEYRLTPQFWHYWQENVTAVIPWPF